MVAQATPAEALKVLHNLWKKRQIETSQVKHLLLTGYFLNLTSITNGGITAEAHDGSSKYSID